METSYKNKQDGNFDTEDDASCTLKKKRLCTVNLLCDYFFLSVFRSSFHFFLSMEDLASGRRERKRERECQVVRRNNIWTVRHSSVGFSSIMVARFLSMD